MATEYPEITCISAVIKNNKRIVLIDIKANRNLFKLFVSLPYVHWYRPLRKFAVSYNKAVLYSLHMFAKRNKVKLDMSNVKPFENAGQSDNGMSKSNSAPTKSTSPPGHPRSPEKSPEQSSPEHPSPNHPSTEHPSTRFSPSVSSLPSSHPSNDAHGDNDQHFSFSSDHIFNNDPTRRNKPPREVRPIDNEVIECINDYVIYLQQKRYSPSTVKSYRTVVKQFFSFYSTYDIYTITPKEVEYYNYHKYVKDQKSHAAQNQFISALKLFYTFHKVDNIIPEELARPRRNKYLPNVLSKEEVKCILMSCSNIKHRCLLTVVYGAGLRVGEILNLKLTDIRFEERLIYIRSAKGRKDRRVPLSATMTKMIQEYTFACKPKVWLFEGPGDNQYSISSAQNIIRKAVRKCNLSFKVTMHTLRHSYATHLLESGVGLRYIQEILGHNSPKTTMIYTHVSGKRIGDVRSPLEDMGL